MVTILHTNKQNQINKSTKPCTHQVNFGLYSRRVVHKASSDSKHGHHDETTHDVIGYESVN